MPFEYDKNGNLTFDGQFRYYYDCENRLIDVNDSGDEPVASYKYDWMGRRVSKTDYTLSPARCTLYLYDGWRCIREYTEAGAAIRTYFYGTGIDEPICMFDAADNNKVYYYFFDGLGSVAALSDAVGDTVERYEYDVFGKVTIKDEDCAWLGRSSVGNPYFFTARRYDYESGTYYYRARYYDPSLGRFLQVDPTYYDDKLNRYRYVGNSPTMRVDPSGLAGCGLCERLFCSWRLDSSSKYSKTVYILTAWPCIITCPYIAYDVYDSAVWKCWYKGKVCKTKIVPSDWVSRGVVFIRIPFGEFAPITIVDPPGLQPAPPWGPPGFIT